MDDPREPVGCPFAHAQGQAQAQPQGQAPGASLRFHQAHQRPAAPDPAEGESPRLSLVAYERGAPVDGILYRMPPRRGWMDRTSGRGAYRCLPLVVANQAGWIVRNPFTFSVLWNGGRNPAGLQIGIPDGQQGWGGQAPEAMVASHFGDGILTFQLPFLFRTSPGYNLWVKGPANAFKDGVQALEGMVETDWSHAPFTMNWKVTRSFETITFLEGEVICQLVPYPRGLIERFDPEIRPMASNPELHAAFDRWVASRGRFLQDLADPASAAAEQGWQKDYYQGRQAEGERFPSHQTALEVKEFVRVTPPGA